MNYQCLGTLQNPIFYSGTPVAGARTDMDFKSIPILGKLYWGAICLAALYCIWDVVRGCAIPKGWEILSFAAVLGLASLSGGKKVNILKSGGESVSMSLGFVVTFTAMLRFGPLGAVAANCIGCIASCMFPKRQPAYQFAFNFGLSVIEAFLGAETFKMMSDGSMSLASGGQILALVGSATAYYLSNTWGVSFIISLCSKQNPFKVWKDTFLWVGPSYMASASVAALLYILLGNNIGVSLLLLLPIGVFAHQWHRSFVQRTEEQLAHLADMQKHQEDLAALYLSTIKSLALAIDAKDQYTHQHIIRVQKYAVAIAKEMGLTGNDLEAVNTGALLHDIGKLGVPEYVLLKPGKLTDEEFDKIKMHPEIGAAILEPVPFPYPVLPVVRHHHEKWDGTGYPDRLKGEEIPLSARIMAVADVYDALTSSRSYRNAWPHEQAFNTIVKDAGTHFDPVVVEAFKTAILPVIQEMAEQGEGPLTTVPASPVALPEATTQAAEEINKAGQEILTLYTNPQTIRDAEFGEPIAQPQVQEETGQDKAA
ncbi:MAG: HD-GYP domain-containing protein [Armatimonadetes bacterium]|nr:HD-GYP domain-containing protein [Armatimonadota bacterium]